MNGIELQDREFFAAIREGREPNASSVGLSRSPKRNRPIFCDLARGNTETRCSRGAVR